MNKNNFLHSISVLLKKDILVTIGGMIHKKRKGRFVTSAASMAVMCIFIVGIFVFNSVMQTVAYATSGMPHYGVLMNCVTSMMVGLLFAFTRLSSSQTTNDAQLLLALPLSKNAVVLSKTISYYLYDLFPMFVLVVPSLVTHVVLLDASIAVLFRGLVFVVALPFLFVAITCFLTAMLSYFSGKFRSTDKVVTVLTMLVILGYMGMVMGSSSMSTDTGAMPTNIIVESAPFKIISSFIFEGNWLSLLYILIICFVPFLLSIKVYAKGFGKSKTYFKSKDRTLSFSSVNIKKTLFIKERKRYLNSMIYVMNTAIGLLIMTAFIIMVVLEVGPFALLFNEPLILEYRAIIFTVMICFFSCMTCTTCSSISIEGKQIWIIKSLPINYRQLFMAKIKVNLMVTLPFILLNSVIIIISSGYYTNPINCFYLIALPVTCTFLNSLSGLLINLINPKMDWDNEVAVIKQSMAVILSMLVGMAIVAIPVAIYLLLAMSVMSILVYYTIVCVVYIALAYLVWVIIKKKGPSIIMEL